MELSFTRITRQYVDIPVNGTLASGLPATITDVQVALLPFDAKPSATAVWIPAAVTSGKARVLMAGPDSDPLGGLQLSSPGADVWVSVIDGVEISLAFAGRIDVSR